MLSCVLLQSWLFAPSAVDKSMRTWLAIVSPSSSRDETSRLLKRLVMQYMGDHHSLNGILVAGEGGGITLWPPFLHLCQSWRNHESRK